jgi:voltage-gated potassium channel
MLNKPLRSSGGVTGLLRRSGPGLKVALFFLCVLILSSILVFVIERDRNAGFGSFFDSLWWTVVTVSTVGYGDRVPLSVAGKAVAAGTMFLGVAMMAVVTGRIASFLMERQMKQEKGLLSFHSMRNHFIICGWKQEMNSVLQAILANNPGITPSQVVLINKAPEEDVNAVRSDPRFREIRTIHGDFIEERDLVRAGIRKAARVLVLADYYTPGNLQQLDSKTVMAVMTIKNLNRRAYVCAELLEPTFAKYLQLSHCEEILFARDFSRAMLASASSGTGLTHVIRDLLVKEEGGWIETRKVPKPFVGKTFHDLREHYYSTIGAQLIGLLENTGNINDRKREALIEAQKNPDISKLVPELKSIKTLAANKPVINPDRNYVIDRYARAIVVRGPSATTAEAAQ